MSQFIFIQRQIQEYQHTLIQIQEFHLYLLVRCLLQGQKSKYRKKLLSCVLLQVSIKLGDCSLCFLYYYFR